MPLGDIVLILTYFSAYFRPKSSSPSIVHLYQGLESLLFHQFPIDSEVRQRFHEDILSLSAKRQMFAFASFVEWRLGSAETHFVEIRKILC